MIHFKTTDEKDFRFDVFRKEIIEYTGMERNVVVPTHIGGMEVVSIGPDAFWNKGLTSIILPPTLSVIGFYAFAFNHLEDVEIPENVSLIEDGAFMYNRIDKLKLGNNLFSIPQAAFFHNKLTTLTLPVNAQEILSDAFGENPLREIEFEGTPTFIHRHAFNLTRAEMDKVTVTGGEAIGMRTLLEHHARHVDQYRYLRSRRRK